jgi:hypothetical protein
MSLLNHHHHHQHYSNVTQKLTNVSNVQKKILLDATMRNLVMPVAVNSLQKI